MSEESLTESDARELVNQSMRLTACASERPGECCDYHEGYWDALCNVMDRHA